MYTASECNDAGRMAHTDRGSVNLEQCCTMATYVGVSFCISFLNCFVQYLSGGQNNYLCKALVMYRIMGDAGSKHVVSATQGNGMIIYIEYSKMYISEVTCQYYERSDW